MKKILSLVLVAIMLVGTVACFASCAGDDEKTLIVAMSPDFAPMEFYDTSKSGTDAIVGFDVILSNAIAKELGCKLIIKSMAFDACMAAVQSGSADLAVSGFSWTAERAENFLITDWYIAGENETEQVVISLANNKFTSAADFAGKKVGAQGGSLQQLLVTEQLVNNGANLVKYENINDAVAALKIGQIDALAVAKGNADAYIANNEGVIDFSGFDFVVEEKYKNNVILVNKKNQQLCDDVNAALAKFMEADVYNNWYDACSTYSGIKTIDENGYDDNGNKIYGWDDEGNPIIEGSLDVEAASKEDAAKKAAYEAILAKYKAN